MEGKQILVKLAGIKKQEKEKIKESLKLKQQKQKLFTGAKVTAFVRNVLVQLKVCSSIKSVSVYFVWFGAISLINNKFFSNPFLGKRVEQTP